MRQQENHSTAMQFISRFVLGITLGASLLAMNPSLFSQQAGPDPLPDTPSTTMFPHPENAPYFITGQANIILQGHGPFHSPYEGPNSLQARGEYKTSLVGTLYLGLQLNRKPRYATDAIVDFESAGG